MQSHILLLPHITVEAWEAYYFDVAESWICYKRMGAFLLALDHCVPLDQRTEAGLAHLTGSEIWGLSLQGQKPRSPRLHIKACPGFMQTTLNPESF